MNPVMVVLGPSRAVAAPRSLPLVFRESEGRPALAHRPQGSDRDPWWDCYRSRPGKADEGRPGCRHAWSMMTNLPRRNAEAQPGPRLRSTVLRVRARGA